MGYRPHLKIRLNDSPLAIHAAQVIEHWRSARQLAYHVPRAISMYYALLQGDTSLLAEYFPFLMPALQNGQTPATAPTRRRDVAPPPVITIQEKSADDDAADLLDSLGI